MQLPKTIWFVNPWHREYYHPVKNKFISLQGILGEYF